MATAAATPDPEITAAISSFLEESEPEEFGPEEPARREAEPGIVPVDSPSRRAPEPREPERTREPERAREPAEPAEPESIQTVSDLATLFQVKEAELLETLTIQLPEEEDPITLRELVDRAVAGPAAQDPELTEAIATMERDREAANREVTNAVGVLNAHAHALLSLIEQDQAKIATLREQDPIRALELRDEVDRRRAALDKAFRDLERLRAEAGERDQHEHKAWVKREAALLVRAVPAWRNRERASEDHAAITKYLTSIGFSQDEARGIVDHRYLVAARDAYLYRTLMAKIRAAKGQKKAGLAVPGVTLKRLARDERGRFAGRKDDLDRDWNRLEQTGDERAAASLILELEDLD